jgi:hypothetical protein
VRENERKQGRENVRESERENEKVYGDDRMEVGRGRDISLALLGLVGLGWRGGFFSSSIKD